jgi:hypothetical protein
MFSTLLLHKKPSSNTPLSIQEKLDVVNMVDATSKVPCKKIIFCSVCAV